MSVLASPRLLGAASQSFPEYFPKPNERITELRLIGLLGVQISLVMVNGVKSSRFLGCGACRLFRQFLRCDGRLLREASSAAPFGCSSGIEDCHRKEVIRL